MRNYKKIICKRCDRDFTITAVKKSQKYCSEECRIESYKEKPIEIIQ